MQIGMIMVIAKLKNTALVNSYIVKTPKVKK